MNDKTQTFEFEGVENKPTQDRDGSDEYSEARRNKEHLQKRRREEKGNGPLIALIIILIVLLIAAIVAGIFILKQPHEPQEADPEIIIENETEEEEPPEVQNVTVACNIVFYPESVIAKEGKYTVLADLYDEGMFKFDNRKLIIDTDTDIRQSGTRLTLRALIYIIENSGGDMPVFEGEINEADGRVISLSFEEPIMQEQEEEVQEEETAEEVIQGENAVAGEVIE